MKNETISPNEPSLHEVKSIIQKKLLTCVDPNGSLIWRKFVKKLPGYIQKQATEVLSADRVRATSLLFGLGMEPDVAFQKTFEIPLQQILNFLDNGLELYEKCIDELVGGLYATNPESIEISATTFRTLVPNVITNQENNTQERYPLGIHTDVTPIIIDMLDRMQMNKTFIKEAMTTLIPDSWYKLVQTRLRNRLYQAWSTEAILAAYPLLAPQFRSLPSVPALPVQQTDDVALISATLAAAGLTATVALVLVLGRYSKSLTNWAGHLQSKLGFFSQAEIDRPVISESQSLPETPQFIRSI